MQRRRFVTATALGGAALGAAASVLPMPAIAQSMPEIKWRMASSFPEEPADALWRRGIFLQQGRGRNRQQVPDPGLRRRRDRAGAAGAGCGAERHRRVRPDRALLLCRQGPDLRLRLHRAVRLQRAPAAGLDAAGRRAGADNEFTKDYNVTGFIAGNTGAQMGGWFRQELKSPDDMKGLKFRIAGLAGQVIAKLGGVPQQIGGGDIYPALEKGTIDAAEWVGPYDDERLGFYKIAKFYYYPGWWEGNAQLWMYVNLDQWAQLPPAYKAVFEAACAETNNWMQAKYDAENPAALRRLVANGAQLRPFSREIMQAAYKASVRGLRRDRRQEPEVQEDLRGVEGIPRGPVSVVPRRREHVRELRLYAERGGGGGAARAETLPPCRDGCASAARSTGSTSCWAGSQMFWCCWRACSAPATRWCAMPTTTARMAGSRRSGTCSPPWSCSARPTR